MIGKGMVRCILCEAFINLREGRFAKQTNLKEQQMCIKGANKHKFTKCNARQDHNDNQVWEAHEAGARDVQQPHGVDPLHPLPHRWTKKSYLYFLVISLQRDSMCQNYFLTSPWFPTQILRERDWTRECRRERRRPGKWSNRIWMDFKCFNQQQREQTPSRQNQPTNCTLVRTASKKWRW